MKKSKKIIAVLGATLSMLLCGCGKEEATTECAFDYDNPIWNWSNDYSTASVSFICLDCGKESELYNANVTLDDKQPTCNDGAIDTYTAKVIVNNKQYEDTKTVNEGKLGHDFELTYSGTYKKNYQAGEKFDKTGLVIQKVCKRDKSHTENVSLSNVLISYNVGNAFKAGDTKVTAHVGTLTVDIIVDPVSKAIPVISLPDLSTTCHTEPDLSGVTTSIGNVIVKYYADSSCMEEVPVTELVEGEYATKAIVEASNDNERGEKVGKLTVSHDFSERNTDESYCVSPATCSDDAVYKYSCLCGEESLETFVQTGSALGHDFSIINVSGTYKTNYEAFEHFNPEGIVVEKVCSHDNKHNTIVDPSEFSFIYENGSEFHLGDQKVTLAVGKARHDIEVTIEKANPVINFGELKTTCHHAPNYSNVTTSAGTISSCTIYSDSECTNVVPTNQLVAGTYFVKATINEGEEWNKAEQVGNLIVEHNPIEVTDSKDPQDRIGAKILSKCSECGEASTFAEKVNTYRGWGMGSLFVNSPYVGVTTSGSDLTDYPEYTGSGEFGTYRVWVVNNETSNMSLPRIDFRSFNSISLIYHTNTNINESLKIGVGLKTAGDLLPFVNRDNHSAFAINASYDKTTNKVMCTINSSAGESSDFVITDKSIIKGDTALNLIIQGDAWRSIVFHDFMINHVCNDFGKSKNITAFTCALCFKAETVTQDDYVYSTSEFANEKFGISAEGNEFVTEIDTSEDIGAIKLGQPSKQTEGIIHLALATYSKAKNVKYYFSCNAAGSKIGFDNENYLTTICNTKSTEKSSILFETISDEVKVTIKIGEDSIAKTITDADIILGKKSFDLYVNLNSWHYIAISKIVINETNN